MHGHASELRRLDTALWGLIAAVTLTVAVGAAVAGFRIAQGTFLLPTMAVAAGLAGQQFYRTRRRDERLATALGCTAQLIAFAAVGAPLSYLGASTRLPLLDGWFDAADRALGLDWSGLLGWMDSHPALHPLFLAGYASLMPQTVIAVLALSFGGHLARLRVYLLAFVFISLATIAFATLLPAAGPWQFYGVTAAATPHIVPAVHGSYLPVYDGLRDGSYRLLLAAGSDGIITFPSLHAALGLLLTITLWPLRLIRLPILALNTFMIVATPIDGGHYFVDIPAGLAIAAVAYVAACAVAERVRTVSLGLPDARIGAADNR